MFWPVLFFYFCTEEDHSTAAILCGSQTSKLLASPERSRHRARIEWDDTATGRFQRGVNFRFQSERNAGALNGTETTSA